MADKRLEKISKRLLDLADIDYFHGSMARGLTAMLVDRFSKLNVAFYLTGLNGLTKRGFTRVSDISFARLVEMCLKSQSGIYFMKPVSFLNCPNGEKACIESRYTVLLPEVKSIEELEIWLDLREAEKSSK